MKITKFQDNSGNHIQISYASDGDIRVYIGETFETDSKVCLKLSRAQAILFVTAIIDLAGDK